MRLIVDNLWTMIQGDKSLIEKPTSYFKQGAWFSKLYRQGKWDGRVRFIERDPLTKMNKFPTGLLRAVVDHLDTLSATYDVVDVRQIPEVTPKFTLAHSSLGQIHLDQGKYDYQGQALEESLLQGRGILKLATNGGKTELGAAIINSVGGQWMWVTGKKGLLFQTRDRLSERLQQPIGILGDQQEDLQDVTVCMVQTIDSVFKKSGREHIRDWCRMCVGFIGDEMHHCQSDQWYRNFCEFPAAWRFGLTATPPLDHDGGMFLQAITGSIIYEVPSLELIARGVSVPPRIWYIPMDGPELKKKEAYPTIYSQGIVHNQQRNERIAKVARIFASERKPTLILVNRLNHGKEIHNTLDGQGVQYGWIHGKVKQKDRDAQFDQLWSGRLDCVVAMAECCGEGVDLPHLRAVINATGTRGGGSPEEQETGRLTIQILGRILRSDEGKEYCDYVDFIDNCHKSLLKASLARIETLESEGYGKFIKYWSEYI